MISNLLEKITLEAEHADKAWGDSYPLFSNILNKYELKTGVEIGVAFGGHAEAILKLTQVAKLYGVDPYRNHDDYKDPMNLPQSEFEILYEYTKSRLAVFGDRIDVVRETSSRAAEIIKDQVDFVYIDALHTYEGVRDDLRLWLPKIRDGGVIGGHDYGHPSFPGVKNAVDEFFVRFGWEIRDEGEGVWWVEKKMLSVSFFMPAFNCEKTLKTSVMSIINGNISEGDEIVIVNDGSIDNTSNVIKDLDNEYPYVKYINHLTNKGGATARNTAIENCKNELLFCLDSDNILEKNSISRLKMHLIRNNADIVCFHEVCYFRDNIHNVTHKWIYHKSEFNLSDYLSTIKVPGASGNYMFTKESWGRAGGYPEFSGALDTWGFGFRQIATGSKMVVLPNSHYLHRYGYDSYWVRESKKGKISLTALQIVVPFLDMLRASDVNYMVSKKGRYSWFENIDRHPIRLNDKHFKLISSFADLFRNIIFRIKRLLKIKSINSINILKQTNNIVMSYFHYKK